MTRRDKINYYLDIAETVLSRGTCLRRLYGAIIVKNDQIISTDFRRGKYVSSLAGASAADYIAEYDVDDIYMIYCTYTPIDSSTMQQYMESYLHMEY